jgi:fructose/tagatose bisphosphate aldolase
MTDPRQAHEFVERTRIDALAVAVGNVHGFTAKPVTLDLERLHAIAAQCPVPLVLHGASGLPSGQLRGALACGVAKVNVNAELRRAYLAAVERSLPQAMSNADAVAVWREGRAAVTLAALRIIRSLAPTCEQPSTTEHVTARARSGKSRP